MLIEFLKPESETSHTFLHRPDLEIILQIINYSKDLCFSSLHKTLSSVNFIVHY